MSRQILIIDDQDDILRILERELIKSYQCTVYTARSSSQAFEQLSRNSIELIISDVRIGEENGFAVLRSIRSHYPEVGMMMMTAYRSPGYRQMADELGVAFFVEKPFAISVLAKAVDRFFTQRSTSFPAAPKPAPGKSGGLEHFSVQDLVQLFCLNGRNVIITLDFPPPHPLGKIYLQHGRVVQALWGAQEGEECFYGLLLQPGARLELEDFTTEIAPVISSGWEQLLLEAARRMDEIAETPAAVPAGPPADPFADFWKNATFSPANKLKV